jgi:hypothetical protein
MTIRVYPIETSADARPNLEQEQLTDIAQPPVRCAIVTCHEVALLRGYTVGSGLVHKHLEFTGGGTSRVRAYEAHASLFGAVDGRGSGPLAHRCDSGGERTRGSNRLRSWDQHGRFGWRTIQRQPQHRRQP